MTTSKTGFDVIVVGLGGAGVAAAIEAADAGAQVLVLERYAGGGATALSGGIVYAGGGTRIQREAGVEDDPDNMYAYLSQEVGDAVSEKTLRRFVETSPAMVDWLEANGVPLEGSLCPFKTSFPTDDYYLYYSGSELAEPFASKARPAARGHRAKGPGTSGGPLMKALIASARRRGIEIRTGCRVVGLHRDADGGATLDVEVFRGSTPVASAVHSFVTSVAGKPNNYFPQVAGPINAVQHLTERAQHVRQIRARQAVILAGGGFAYNRRMVQQYAPGYIDATPLGTTADDGGSIRLGESVGGVTAHMDRTSAWRFINPPASMTRGVLVGPSGARICNELFYGARTTRHMVAEHGGASWLIVDQPIFDRVREEMNSQCAFFQLPQVAWLLSPAGHTRAASIDDLEARLELPPGALVATIDTYNADVLAGRADAMLKHPDYVQALATGPFYAFDCSVKNAALFPCPMITLGGLVVDEDTGELLDGYGTPLTGVYAAGRSAVGICSDSYVSGLSIADAFFSGRRAGAHAAGLEV